MKPCSCFLLCMPESCCSFLRILTSSYTLIYTFFIPDLANAFLPKCSSLFSLLFFFALRFAVLSKSRRTTLVVRLAPYSPSAWDYISQHSSYSHTLAGLGVVWQSQTRFLDGLLSCLLWRQCFITSHYAASPCIL